jgi:trehalose/maltose hydrolase-like predicted phosphorylase
VSFVRGDNDARDLRRATRLSEMARARGYASLAAESRRMWQRRWGTDILIEGDPALQKVVRSMLFYLLCSADSGTSLGIPPMGLSSAGYYGHIFWDSDTWMFPSLLVTHPDVAHSLVAFRARTLPAARANAKANGFRGAMYPWEADERGDETTPHFAVQNARSEIHVNGDVALAQWQYYLATGDSAWLSSQGHQERRLGLRRADRGERRCLHQRGCPEKSGDRCGGKRPPGQEAGSRVERSGYQAPHAIRLGQRVLPHL